MDQYARYRKPYDPAHKERVASHHLAVARPGCWPNMALIELCTFFDPCAHKLSATDQANFRRAHRASGTSLSYSYPVPTTASYNSDLRRRGRQGCVDR